jgi:hypothetical protein
VTGALSPAQALELLQDELLIGAHRARVVQVIGTPALLESFRAVASELPEHDRLRFVEVVPGCEEELHELNLERNLLFDELAALVFLVASREAARLLRRHANDLTSVFDLSVELTPATSGTSSADAVHALRTRLIELHGVLDLTGLVPGETDALRHPMEQIFFDEAGLQPRHFELLTRHEAPLLVIAQPGAGKTTALRHACWDGCRRNEAGEASTVSGRDVFVFVPLAAWYADERQRPTALTAWLDTWLQHLASPPVALAEVLPRLVLLLDGLDEVGGPSIRRDLLGQALELHQRGAAVLVSARDHVVDDLRKQEMDHWSVARLAERDREPPHERARRFALQVAMARHPDDPERAGRIADQVVRHGHEDFYASPLMMTFIVVLADLRDHLPTWSVELYRDLVELLLHARRGEGPRWRRGELLRVLAPLGWELVRRGVGGLRREELLETLIRLERVREPDPELACQAASVRLDQLVDGTSLLSAADGLYRFQHPTLAEYFAARSVLQDASHRAVVVAEPYANVSSTVVAFAVGLVSDLEPDNAVEAELLNALVRRSKRQGRYDSKIPVLLCRLLREVETLPSSVRAQLADAAVRVALGRSLSRWARRTAVRDLDHSDHLPEIRAAVDGWLADPKRTEWESLAADQVEDIWDWNEFFTGVGAGLAYEDRLRQVVATTPVIRLLADSGTTTIQATLEHLLNLSDRPCHAVVWALWISGGPDEPGKVRRRAIAASQDAEAVDLLPVETLACPIPDLAPAAELALARRYPALLDALSASPAT